MEICNKTYDVQDAVLNQQYQINSVQKEEILKRLRAMGCRITKQRKVLIDVILESECTCCKEIYYIAAKKMPEIGMATIYRTLNSLEDIGAIQRRNVYRICTAKECEVENCIIELEDESRVTLTKEALQEIVEAGMKACGYTDFTKVKRIIKRNGC